MFKNFRNKLNYWLEKKMPKGTFSMITLLTVCTLLVVLTIAIIVTAFNIEESEGFVYSFWDLLVTTIDASLPSSEDGSFVYILLYAIAGIVGLFFTSILIGIIANFVEEKVQAVKNGTSVIYEKGHTVVLGYNLGEHALMKQLILNTGDKKRVFVICSSTDKEELESDLADNLDIPKNITIICRNCDITSITELKNFAIESAGTVIINALSESIRIKSILAVASLLVDYKEDNPCIVACVNDDRHMLPKLTMDANNIIMFKLNDIMAKIIARTATEPGLSEVYNELFNYEYCELHTEVIEKLVGLTVSEAASCIDEAILMAIKRDGNIILNPGEDEKILSEDELVLFEEETGAFSIRNAVLKDVDEREAQEVEEDNRKLVIIGYNDLLPYILDEVSDTVSEIVVAGVDAYEEEISYCIKNYHRCHASIYEGYIIDDVDLSELVENASHIVILSDRTKDFEDADTDNIVLLLRLKELKQKMNFKYTITAEFMMEASLKLIEDDEETDFVISSHLSALVLAQMSETPDLKDTFSELLSREGNNLYSMKASRFNIVAGKDYSTISLKQIMLSYGFTLLGYMKGFEVHLNPRLDERITFEKDDRLIIMGIDKEVEHRGLWWMLKRKAYLKDFE